MTGGARKCELSKHQDYPGVNWDWWVHQHGNEQLSLAFTVVAAGVFVL